MCIYIYIYIYVYRERDIIATAGAPRWILQNEEFARLAETRLAQNSFNYLLKNVVTLKKVLNTLNINEFNVS